MNRVVILAKTVDTSKDFTVSRAQREREERWWVSRQKSGLMHSAVRVSKSCAQISVSLTLTALSKAIDQVFVLSLTVICPSAVHISIYLSIYPFLYSHQIFFHTTSIASVPLICSLPTCSPVFSPFHSTSTPLQFYLTSIITTCLV